MRKLDGRTLDLDRAKMLSHGKLGRRLPLPEEAHWVTRDVQLVMARGEPGLRWDSTSIGDLKKDPRRFQYAMSMSSVETAAPAILDAFVVLADAPPERALAFARKYGRLELCEHWLPHFHESAPGFVKICKTLNPEPIALYTKYAREVQAILQLAAAAHRGSMGSPEQWHQAWHLLAPDEPTASHRLDYLPALLTMRIGWWLSVGDVRAVFMWLSEPQVRLGGLGGTWGAIARQLAFAVCRAELVTCAGCGMAFTPQRRQARRDSWCPTCGKRAADRESKRRQRAR